MAYDPFKSRMWIRRLTEEAGRAFASGFRAGLLAGLVFALIVYAWWLLAHWPG